MMVSVILFNRSRSVMEGKEINTRDLGPQLNHPSIPSFVRRGLRGGCLRAPQGSNTEVTEGLRALSVKASGSTEVTETLFLVAVVPRWVKGP
jgi:hypothetical protein